MLRKHEIYFQANHIFGLDLKDFYDEKFLKETMNYYMKLDPNRTHCFELEFLPGCEETDRALNDNRISQEQYDNIHQGDSSASYNFGGSLDEIEDMLKDDPELTKQERFDLYYEERERRVNKEKNKGECISRGYAQLPNGTGKNIQIAVFATGEKAKEAKDAGADIVGNEDLIKDIKDGKINFDVAIATPDMMKDIAIIGEKLGPLGIMPNPKTGTITDNLSKTIKNIKKGQIQFKSEKNAIVQAGIGKLSFSEENLILNFKELINAINKSKPDSIKGKFINKVYLSTSMGPSIRVENIK